AMLTEQAEPHFLSTDASSWLSRLEADHDNLRAALTWCFGDGGDSEIGARMAGAASRFWQIRSHLTEGQRWLDLALTSRVGGRDSCRVKALHGAGWLAHNRGDLGQAAEYFGQATQLARQLGDRSGLAHA